MLFSKHQKALIHYKFVLKDIISSEESCLFSSDQRTRVLFFVYLPKF